MQSPVAFGRTLSNSENEHLRQKITALALPHLSKPLHCDTLLGLFASDHLAFSSFGGLFLLLDYHRILLYDNSGSDMPGIGAILDWIVDDYPNQPFDLFAAHAASRPFRFLYELDVFDLLAVLWQHAHPGVLVAVDLVTGEIRTSQSRFHPAADSVARRAADNQNLSRSMPGTFAVRDCLVGPSLRTRELPDLEDLISLDLGIIRNEHITIRDTIVPSVVDRMSTDHGASQTICGGKDFHLPAAIAVARLEAIERYHALFPSPAEPRIYASYSSLAARAINPSTLCFNVLPWENDTENPKWATYTDSSPMYWIWAEDILARDQRLVPAQEVYMTPLSSGETSYTGATTSACALGGCADEAALFAIFEAVERDAYLTTWYMRRCCRKIIPSSVRYEPFQLLWARIRSAFPNYAVHLIDMSADIALPSIAAIAVKTSGHGPRTVHAAATRLFSEQALFKALVDVAGELEHGRRTKPRKQLLENPGLVASPEDHRDLYALDEVFDRLFFFAFDQPPTIDARELNLNAVITPQPRYNIRSVLTDILAHCKDKGILVLLKDLSQPSFVKRGLHCVRAIASGLYPMWFGYHNRRFSLTSRLKTLGMRFTGRTLTTDADVNLELHPFS